MSNFSMDICFKLYGHGGDRLDVSQDRDGSGLVELMYFLSDKPNESVENILVHPDQVDMLVEALLAIRDRIRKDEAK